MLRRTVRSFGALSVTDNSVPAAQLSRSSSARSKSDDNHDDDDVGTVRKWMTDLKSKPIPESVPEFTFSKSSGPGGQHVDKTNSKATMRLPIDKLKSYSPQILHAHLLENSHYVKNSHSLLIRCQETRSQPENKRICWDKLYDSLRETAETYIRNESAVAFKRDKPINSPRNDVRYIGCKEKFTMSKVQFLSLKHKQEEERRKAKNAAKFEAAQEAKRNRKMADGKTSGK